MNEQEQINNFKESFVPVLSKRKWLQYWVLKQLVSLMEYEDTLEDEKTHEFISIAATLYANPKFEGLKELAEETLKKHKIVPSN